MRDLASHSLFAATSQLNPSQAIATFTITPIAIAIHMTTVTMTLSADAEGSPIAITGGEDTSVKSTLIHMTTCRRMSMVTAKNTTILHGGEHGPSHAARSLSLGGLFALGITGGIVPCPAALVVLLGALAFHRVAFGLFLIVAFSAGLAAVLISLGLAMVYAGRFMSRFGAQGPLTQRWLPLASSAVITVIGITLTLQSLVTVGVLRIGT